MKSLPMTKAEQNGKVTLAIGKPLLVEERLAALELQVSDLKIRLESQKAGKI